MKVFFGAQSSILRVFCKLDKQLRNAEIIHSSAYWISDSEYYFNWEKNSDFLSHNEIKVFFEWDYTNKKKNKTINKERLAILKKRYMDFNLWNVCISDRRLMYGPLSKFHQCYSPRFDHTSLCNIIYGTLDALDQYIEDYNPDAIINFVPASYGDYILALVAKFHNIKYLQLRSTKIKNYVFFSDRLNAVSKNIKNSFRQNIQYGAGHPYEKEAEKYILEAKTKPIDYEGTIQRRETNIISDILLAFKHFISAVKRQFFPINPILKEDNHVPSPIMTWYYTSILSILRRNNGIKIMKKRLISLNKINTVSYLFYPMHSEPEIALSIYGHDHQNQIETIRRIAQSLPLDWRLVVKEHPRSMGLRSSSYYHKLLEIPNLWFADSNLQPYYLIKEAKAVATISGFVGFEALMVGKPVLVLGDVSYSLMPTTMLRQVRSMSEFSNQLNELMQSFYTDEKALKAFISACMIEGCPVNLYSDLLNKQGRNSPKYITIDNQYNNLFNLLSHELLKSS